MGHQEKVHIFEKRNCDTEGPALNAGSLIEHEEEVDLLKILEVEQGSEEEETLSVGVECLPVHEAEIEILKILNEQEFEVSSPESIDVDSVSVDSTEFFSALKLKRKLIDVICDSECDDDFPGFTKEDLKKPKCCLAVKAFLAAKKPCRKDICLTCNKRFYWQARKQPWRYCGGCVGWICPACTGQLRCVYFSKL